MHPTLPRDIDGRVATLVTIDGDGPVGIPVSTVCRVDDRRVLVGLGHRRQSLGRLQADRRCALVLIGPGFAVNVRGTATVVRPALDCLEHLAAVLIDAEHVQDAMSVTTRVHESVRWGWSDAPSHARHRAVLDELGRLAAELRQEGGGSGP